MYLNFFILKQKKIKEAPSPDPLNKAATTTFRLFIGLHSFMRRELARKISNSQTLAGFMLKINVKMLETFEIESLILHKAYGKNLNSFLSYCFFSFTILMV